ncbi:hypothetical protein V1460_02530 [Streptomyces sp. SCSIO 30461]|uniref:hypothetical protein n=1 Tax=Streptomyces sp. SCSIO 30461 TaxID=3118085 RepID=UPI0030D297E2
MLASTVQFSSNDQPPTTPLSNSEFTGAGNPKDEQRSHPQTPNSAPDIPAKPSTVPRSEEQYWEENPTEYAE